MTTSYQKPVTSEQLTHDRDAHPEREILDGKTV